jgi:hypothetical protein
MKRGKGKKITMKTKKMGGKGFAFHCWRSELTGFGFSGADRESGGD